MTNTTPLATQPATSQEGEAIRLMKASDMPEFEACDVSYLESLACYLDNYARDKGKERLPASKNLFEDMAKRLREYDAIRIALAATPTPPTLSEDLREAAQAVLDNADRPGARMQFGEHDDVWIHHKEVDQTVLDRLDAALARAQVKAS